MTFPIPFVHYRFPSVGVLLALAAGTLLRGVIRTKTKVDVSVIQEEKGIGKGGEGRGEEGGQEGKRWGEGQGGGKGAGVDKLLR